MHICGKTEYKGYLVVRQPTAIMLRSFNQSKSQSVNQSWIFRVIQVIKSLQDPLKLGSDLTGIDDNIRKRGLEEKRFQTLTEGRKRRSRGHVVRQTVPNGRSRDWEGPAANGRQFHGRHQHWSEWGPVAIKESQNKRDTVIAIAW